MKSVCVFCGSRAGKKEAYASQAYSLGQILAKKGFTLIYGGGDVGLMGVVADAVLHSGGKVRGVIPQFLLDREVGHRNLTELVVVESMHQRKMKMAELADAFIALPGGFGTLEETAEIITWNQLALINKPLGLLNIEGFYDYLTAYFDHMVDQEFVDYDFRSSIISDPEASALIDKLASYASNNQQGDLKRS